TRRSQLILISAEEENKLGARAFQQVLSKSHVDGREPVNGPVEAVGQRLARVAERPDYKWRFVVIDDPKQQNAFCLPGGKVAVYTGIFPIAESTNGLAVVLGHEIAHALAADTGVAAGGGALLRGRHARRCRAAARARGRDGTLSAARRSRGSIFHLHSVASGSIRPPSRCLLSRRCDGVKGWTRPSRGAGGGGGAEWCLRGGRSRVSTRAGEL